MKVCNIAVKRKRISLINNIVASEIKHIGTKTPIRKGMILDKKINVLICEIDAKEHEKK